MSGDGDAGGGDRSADGWDDDLIAGDVLLVGDADGGDLRIVRVLAVVGLTAVGERPDGSVFDIGCTATSFSIEPPPMMERAEWYAEPAGGAH